jgi:zinc/manganese transport system substrate-binding protein
MNKIIGILLTVFCLVFLNSCQKTRNVQDTSKKTIVVTSSVLGSIVKELAGDHCEVLVIIPNGLDVHEWEPSAKDIETLLNASLIVENGLGLEGGLSKTLGQARSSGVKIFTASNYIKIRKVGDGEGIPSGDPDQRTGAEDPHLWLDPLAVKEITLALATTLKGQLQIDLTAEASALAKKLTTLNSSIREQVSSIPVENRKLVTGHESLGYFAQAFGFKLVGAIIPSLTTQAEVSASELAALKTLIVHNNIKVVFTETGTPARVAKAIASDSGVKCVEIDTHLLPPDGSYFTMMKNLSATITGSLK